MRLLSTTALLAAALVFMGISMCEPTSEIDHFALAKQVESQLSAPGDYGDPAYDKVSEELQLVQTGDASYAQAQAWLKDIRKGRQDALFRRNEAPEVQEGGFHPSQPAAGEGGGQARGSWTAAGWLPYNDVPSVPSGGGSSAVASASSARAPSSSKCVKGPVVLYGTSWCGVCKEARAFFRSKGVSFVDKDVEADASAMAEMKRKAPMANSYPVIDLGGEIMPGFSESAVSRKLCL